MRSRSLCLLSIAAAALPLLAIAGAGSDEPAPPADENVTQPERHKDPYKPVARDGRRTGPAGRSVVGGYVSIQVNVDAAGNNIIDDAANEPSIAVDPNNPNRMAIGWRQFDDILSDFRQAGYGWTDDGGRTWTFPGVLDPGVFRSDPVLDSDSEGNFYYDSLTYLQGQGYWCNVFKSTDGGQTWGPGVYAYGGDKAWMAIDRTGGIGDGNIYAAWDYAGCCDDNWFTRSVDQAQTWEYPVPVPERPMWGVTAVGPDGEVYVAGRRQTTNTQFVLAKSTIVFDPTNPLAFDFATPINLGGNHQYFLGYGPNPGGLMGQVWVACDHSEGTSRGNVYVLCSVKPPGDDPMDVHFIRSTDGGQTWTNPVRVNDDPVSPENWDWYGTMSVAENGRIDVVYNSTHNNPLTMLSELMYTYSLDTGDTWAPAQVVSEAFDSLLGWPQQNKLGDYYDMTSDLVGVNIAYAATFNGEQDVYYLRIGEYDCNGNGVGDLEDITTGFSTDYNGNEIPDECECLADIDGSGAVDVLDLLEVLAAWGAAGGPADVNYDGVVDVLDLLTVLAAWGDCP